MVPPIATPELDLTSIFKEHQPGLLKRREQPPRTRARSRDSITVTVLVTMDDIDTIPRASGSYARYSHKPRKQVVKYLSTLDAYTLHKPTRIRFPRR